MVCNRDLPDCDKNHHGGNIFFFKLTKHIPSVRLNSHLEFQSISVDFLESLLLSVITVVICRIIVDDFTVNGNKYFI